MLETFYAVGNAWWTSWLSLRTCYIFVMLPLFTASVCGIQLQCSCTDSFAFWLNWIMSAMIKNLGLLLFCTAVISILNWRHLMKNVLSILWGVHRNMHNHCLLLPIYNMIQSNTAHFTEASISVAVGFDCSGITSVSLYYAGAVWAHWHNQCCIYKCNSLLLTSVCKSNVFLLCIFHILVY